MKVSQLKIKIFADGADATGMIEQYRDPVIKGFTTNPTLMRKAGISDYRAFAKEILAAIPDKPISFEVFSDEFDVMEKHALEIASWGRNVYVKIPVTNTKGESSNDLIRRLSSKGVQLNITAVLTLEQVRGLIPCVKDGAPSNISIFAGRIADTGRDPIPLMREAIGMARSFPNIEFIWASPRELLNIFHAEDVGCHIITVTRDVLGKLSLVGKDLGEYSLDTVRMFYQDAVHAGFRL